MFLRKRYTILNKLPPPPCFQLWQPYYCMFKILLPWYMLLRMNFHGISNSIVPICILRVLKVLISPGIFLYNLYCQNDSHMQLRCLSGLTKQISSVRLFSKCYETISPQVSLLIIHILRVPLQFSCGVICRISMGFEEFNTSLCGILLTSKVGSNIHILWFSI